MFGVDHEKQRHRRECEIVQTSQAYSGDPCSSSASVTFLVPGEEYDHNTRRAILLSSHARSQDTKNIVTLSLLPVLLLAKSYQITRQLSHKFSPIVRATNILGSLVISSRT
jgi:hypothetical protein